jgi:proline dehydrogenase
MQENTKVMSSLSLFDDTETAFAYKSNSELKRARFLFGLLNSYPILSKVLNKMGMTLLKWNIPLVKYSIKQLFFKHFCGGESLLKSIPSIQQLQKYKVQTVLDYGVEVKYREDDFDATKDEFLKAIRFAAETDGVPIVSVKVTGLGSSHIFEDYAIDKESLSETEQAALDRTRERLTSICSLAKNLNVAIFIDAEESWYQEALDDMVMQLIKRFNKEKVIIYNTYQMYLKTSLERLKKHHKQAQKYGVLLGAKLVRGAYMDRERERAKEMGYDDPIHHTKQDTDQAFDLASMYSYEHLDEIAVCIASHNAKSNLLLLNRAQQDGNEDHPHLLFCQLYGMSDHITFNLAKEGVKAMKYMPYGKVEDVFPYLSRRAEENSSVTDDAGREFQLADREYKRRLR